MRKILAWIFLIIMWGGVLVFPVCAATTAQEVTATGQIGTDGSYVMDLQIKVKLDTVVDEIYFPIPENARGLELFRGKRERGALQVKIPSRFLAAPIPIHYTAQGELVKSEKEGFLELDVPLLCGFQYPIETMSFTITLPSPLDPALDPVKFTSTTHSGEIETYLDATIAGQTISGTLKRPLTDNASLILHLTVPQEMFPNAQLESWRVSLDDYAMYILGGLALVYWLLFLRCTPPRRVRAASAPEGLSAGELGTALIGQGGDLTMMVLSWAQLGYILIHVDGHNRVMLHKRMEMGNERSGYEQRCFKLLFGKQTQVNGTGLGYARLCGKIEKLPPESRGYFHRRSGSTRIFRLILALVGALGGVALALALGAQVWQEILLGLILAPLGFGSSFLMQDFILGLHLRNRPRLVLGLGLSAAWLLVSLWASEPVVGVWMVSCQLLGGLAYGYGGRRTDLGKLTMGQILGLRRYLLTVPKPELQRTLRQRPDYFFTMAPYAAALGVDAAFAARFGGKRLPACPYLTTGMDGHMSARDWDKLLRRTITALDSRAKRLPLERLLALLLPGK